MNKVWLIIGGILIVMVLGAAQLWYAHPIIPTVPTATSTPKQKVTAPPAPVAPVVTVQKGPASDTVSISAGDTIVSWNFKGAYTDTPDLITKAEVEIKRLLSLIGKGTYSDTSLYIGIANQYELLGEGKQEYEYLTRAITADSTHTSGLPWHNLGVLMERLGALQSARVAYEKSTLIQPAFKFYHYAYLEFLTTRLKDDVTAIEKEFAAAIQNLGQDADIVQLHAQWQGL
jgi:hypothetical protein